MHNSYVTKENIISDFVSDYEVDLKEGLLHKWIDDITEQVCPDTTFINKVGFVDVKGFKAMKPKDIELVCEVAYRLDCPKDKTLQRRERVSQWVQQTDEGCEIEINLKCPTCHKTDCNGCGKACPDFVEVDVSRIWELNNPFHNYMSKFGRVGSFGRGQSVYTPEFKLLKFKEDKAWRGLAKHLGECSNITCDCEDSYYFTPSTIETTFKEGQLLLSYMARPSDDQGNLLIPDDPVIIEAVVDYLLYKTERKNYHKTREAKDYRAYMDAERVHYASLGRARSKLQMPSFESWSEWLSKNRYHKIDSAYDNLLRNGVNRVPRRYSRNKTRNY